MRLRAVWALLFAATLVAAAGAARADAIDGDWCFTDGKHFSIKGTQITTPAGKPTTGDYSRHYFSYVVPEGEAQAGTRIDMTLMGENLVHLRRGQDPAAPTESWRRCTAAVS